MSFIQRFGSALNAHLHFHCCLIDGVFATAGEGMRSYEATALGEAGVVAVQGVVRRRVLGLFERPAVIDPQALADMRQ